MARMAGDKKATGGRLTLILAYGIGRAFVAKDVDPDTLRAFLIAEVVSLLLSLAFFARINKTVIAPLYGPEEP